MKLRRNRIRCRYCKNIIESKSEHDFKYCKCKTVAVDGGLDYAKRIYPTEPPEDHYEELAEYE